MEIVNKKKNCLINSYSLLSEMIFHSSDAYDSEGNWYFFFTL